jgi:glutathione-regulated potassium-efflux system ancillary protein KefG
MAAMKPLILFAHPRLSDSRVQKSMLAAIDGLEGITLHDLYAAYPDFAIDVDREQNLLLAHDIVIFQHPFYWYSAPAIIKEWLDLVLEYGWAYGPGGNRLHRKFMMSAVSTGGPAEAYRPGGRNRFAVRDLLSPFNQSAYLCGMGWLEPFVIFGGRRLSEVELTRHCEAYRDLIIGLRDGRLDPLKHLAKGYELPSSFAGKAA